MAGLSLSDTKLLATLQHRFQSIAQGESEQTQAELLELDVLLRDGVFCKPLPQPRRVRSRRGKFVPKFV